MSKRNHFRSGMALPSGNISYGNHVERDGLIYSIDKFRPRFPLKWGALRLQKDGNSLSLTDANVTRAVIDSLLRPVYDGIISGSSANRSGVVWSCWIDGVWLAIWKFKAFHGKGVEGDYCYSLLVELNPNKHLGLPWIVPLFRQIHEVLGDWFCWHETRVDFAADLPYNIHDVRLLSRKEPSSFLGSYYFGIRGHSGYTRVYDKLRQLREVDQVDIGSDTTRIEWERHGGTPFAFDTPYLLGDLGTHAVLRFVPMDRWPDALRTYDPKTAKKIKTNSLTPVPFDPSVFDGLYTDLLQALQLNPADNVDHLLRNQIERDLEEQRNTDLEYVASELRRWSGNNE